MTWNHYRTTDHFSIDSSRSTVGDTSLKLARGEVEGHLIWNASESESPNEVRLVTDMRFDHMRSSFTVLFRHQDEDNYYSMGLWLDSDNSNEGSWVLERRINGSRSRRDRIDVTGSSSWTDEPFLNSWRTMRFSAWIDPLGNLLARVEIWNADTQEWDLYENDLSDSSPLLDGGGGLGVGQPMSAWTGSDSDLPTHIDATELMWP